MADPNPNPATRFKPGVKHVKPPSLLAHARKIEQILFDNMQDPNCKRTDLSRLVSSFVLLVDCIRELRQVPRQGMLRPDLDPVQALKMMNRLRTRMTIDVPGTAAAGLSDGPTAGRKPLGKGWKRKSRDAEEVTEHSADIETDANAGNPEDNPTNDQPESRTETPSPSPKPIYGTGTA
jgi:hypothetical protein